MRACLITGAAGYILLISGSCHHQRYVTYW